MQRFVMLLAISAFVFGAFSAWAQEYPPVLTVDLGSGQTLELVLVPAGRFLMGSPENERGRDTDEGPIREIEIGRPFYLGKYEVTQAQYQALTGKNPSHFQGERLPRGVDSSRLPVEQVAWTEAREYCSLLTERKDGTFRLPSEAEWEYACRAGSSTRYSFGDDERELGKYAWYSENSGGRTNEVGRKLPNAFGLFDMHGNVWEWTQDTYSFRLEGIPTDGSPNTSENPLAPRVLKSGGWGVTAPRLRSAMRAGFSADYRGYLTGFRVVREVE